MAKRRHLRGKKLLFVSGAIAGVSFIGCGDDATANLIAPPDTGAVDSAADAADDAADSTVNDAALDTSFPIDAVANLIAPPDVGPDASGDGSADGG